MTRRALSPLQHRHIREAIRDGHLAFVAEMFGPAAIDRDDYDRLRAQGKIRDDKLLPQDAALAAHSIGSVAGREQAETLGVPASSPSAAFGSAGDASADDFWRRLRDDPQVATESDRDAVSSLRDRVARHVRDLGNKLDDAVSRALADEDDAARRDRLVKVGTGADHHASAQRALSRIREAAANLRRDWFRVVHTSVHDAVEEAKSIAIASRVPGRDPRVFKRTRSTACSFCKLLYLKPNGVVPRVFRLSALLANGTNSGRRAGRPTRSGKSRTQWKAVLGSVHPFCGCELFVLPDDMGFDDQGRLTRVGVKKSTLIEVEPLDKGAASHDCEE